MPEDLSDVLHKEMKQENSSPQNKILNSNDKTLLLRSGGKS